MSEEGSALSALSFEPEPYVPSPDPISVCKCILSTSDVSEEVPKRKMKIFSTVSRTEAYLRERRIPELIRFLMAKIIASETNDPVEFTMDLLDKCMLFRAGIGPAPVLFEDRHLEAVVKSFDPGNRGWMSAGQVRRAFITLGLNPEDNLKEEKYATEGVLNRLRTAQEQELYNLIGAGTVNNLVVEASRSSSKT